MNTTTKTVNRAFATFIAAIMFTGVVATAPPATAVTWVPEPGTTTPADTFDIALWVAERKARMAQDWVDRAMDRRTATNADFQERGEMVARAKARAAQG